MNAIVAVSQNWAIGRDGKLLFRLSEDLKHFRSLTEGGTVIMGRKTLESLPKGQPLANRDNIILSAQPDIEVPGAAVVHSFDQALAMVQGRDRVFVIGGGSIYAKLLPYCQRAYVTMVDAKADADTYFPNLDRHPDWELFSASEPVADNGYTFRYLEYVRKAG
ncbi:dihydrofolate reductase [Oscillibacter hominis]|uniref:Dihydrofolate reductase n=1 Tax=Oscillibacter hominis TaxID=2763056 RepID=A0A7G9B5J2_9FIRM|nr:dihydrofolate reductase [Oscillibacter hominis]QNL44823.1 dihydrofolate reductase [Oscillibacter hominis]